MHRVLPDRGRRARRPGRRTAPAARDHDRGAVGPVLRCPRAVPTRRRRPRPGAARLGAVRRYLGVIAGHRIINLLGSYGGKAVALAALGADVTVVDIAAENARYALELAQAAGVTIRYIVSDVLALPAAERSGDYDL